MNGNRWAWGAALAFVVTTLAALIIVPMVVQADVDEHRRSIEASEPARTLLMALQFNLARELSALSDYSAKGDTAAGRTFRLARATEREIWNELEPLAVSLGADVHGRFVRARTLAEQWHIRLNEDELLSNPRAEAGLLQSSEGRQRFSEVLEASAQLDSAILQTTQLRRREIERAERSGMWLTLISGALAFIAAALVGLLVLRMRRLAEEAEQRRRQATEALEAEARAAEARQRLLRGVTHDVKNPLGAARGYAELLAMGIKGPVNSEQRSLVEGMERSIDSALAIISDLLDLARADSGGIQVHRIRADLTEIVTMAVTDHQAAAETAGHTLTFAGPHGASVESYTDPARVRQVLDNLISNAIKYTPAPGRITVEIDAKPADAPFSKNALGIRVSDTGPGIPAEHRDRIFNEFTRVDENSSQKGHGLGLSIARRMARLLGGELGLSERAGPGATFVLWLPRREEPDDSRG